MKMIKFPSYNEVQRKQGKGIPFEVTYHPLLKQLEGILRSRSHYLLNTNAEVNQTLTSGPMVFSRSPIKLSTYLGRAKPYPIGKIMGSKGCGKK